MGEGIQYSTELPKKIEQLYELYSALGWDSILLKVDELQRMCQGSWYAVYAFDQQRLVGMGRVISDGVIIGIICGVGVLPDYQSRGIGGEIVSRLTRHCEENRVIPQLMCVEGMESYYEALGFERFSVGMYMKIRTRSTTRS